MRRFALLALPLVLLAAAPAAAQHWNDAGPGRDLLSSTVTDFDSFRQRTPNAPAFTPNAPAGEAQARGPIPLLDWVPPPPVPAAAPTTTRRSTPRRTVRRAPVRQEARETTPLPAAAPAPSRTQASGGQDWERSMAERERELERLRRILEEDRLRYQQARQPQLQ
ncbi:hypothetical protein [Falsiroseomonas tokyonensis]|uniref:Uncharacterized protein n=1 Tax=Falsiroseomonas tokyonensis TaxID=430521 RepID=A0ABV7BRJ7_9PROT|nr:hypothetical protein [Falsiroseomonas tokyonensis]MBU8537061.1 hypothetical protein [Falsiroseomonas tokyonensis]